MNQYRRLINTHGGANQDKLTSYIVGFIYSLVLTLAAYILVVNHLIVGKNLVLVIAGLAVLQLLVQLVFFLHLDRESRPRWNLLVFSFAVLVLFILVFGSLWIMHNLNYHMDSPEQTDTQILQDEGIQR